MKNLIAKREKQQQSKTQHHTVILKTILSVDSRGLLFSLFLMKFPSLVTVIPSPLPNNHHETNTWAYTHAITYFFDDLLIGSSFCLHDCSLKREDTWPTFFYFTHFIFYIFSSMITSSSVLIAFSPPQSILLWCTGISFFFDLVNWLNILHFVPSLYSTNISLNFLHFTKQ